MYLKGYRFSGSSLQLTSLLQNQSIFKSFTPLSDDQVPHVTVTSTEHLSMFSSDQS